MQTITPTAAESTSFADDLVEAVEFSNDADRLLPSPGDLIIGLAVNDRASRDNAREIGNFFRLVNAHNSAYSLTVDRHEKDFDADGRSVGETILDEAAEMGRDAGLSLRSALVPSGYTFDERDSYIRAYELAFAYAEAEALSDREDDWSDCEADSLEDCYQSYLDCERAEMGSSLGHIG